MCGWPGVFLMSSFPRLIEYVLGGHITTASALQQAAPSPGASTADWLAAWSQLGAAVGTVLTLAAALWINRRTRIALDDERSARREDVSRLESAQREARKEQVKATANRFDALAIAAFVELSIVVKWTSYLSIFLHVFVPAFGASVISNLEGDSRDKMYAAGLRRLMTHVFGWVVFTDVVHFRRVVDFSQELLHTSRELDRMAHPDLAASAGKVLTALETFTSVIRQNYRSRRKVKTAQENYLKLVQEFSSAIESGPWLADVDGGIGSTGVSRER